MTREEAIGIIKESPLYKDTTWKFANKLHEAIKALEQEPCEDAISRKVVLEYIEGSEAELGHSSENELVCQHIKEFPPVTPQPKTGCEDGKNEVLDKIRAEIEQTASRYSISKERGCTGQVEWSDRLIKESEVLQIIDKYKTESEVKSCSNCKCWLLDKNDKHRKCRYCFEMDEWMAENEDKE